MHYIWLGIDISGNTKSGLIISENKKNAEISLKNNKITVLSIKKEKRFFSCQKKFSPKNLLDFTQELYLLLKSGIALKQALEFIILVTKNAVIKRILVTIKDYIISGQSLSAALSCFPNYFNKTYCDMISAGEQSSKLETVLKQLIDVQLKSNKIKQKMFGALLYPVSVLLISILITIGLLVFVIPQFTSIYNNFGSQLPKITQNLILMSRVLKHYFLFLIAIFITMVLSANTALKKFKKIRYLIYRFQLTFPVIKNFFILKNVARWSAIFSVLLESGMSLLMSFSIANQTIENGILKKLLENVGSAIRAGDSFSDAISRIEYIPIRAKQLIAIGENSDALQNMLKQVALLHDEALNDLLDHLSKLLEPVMMIVIALLITGLIVAMYLPIFQMGNIV